jgi:hypothetical protein
MEQVNLEISTVVPLVSVDRLYGELNSMIGSGTVTANNIVTVVISLMKIVERYREVKGPQKKAVILRVMDRFIKDRIGNTQEAETISILLQTIIPPLIDTLVSVDTQKLKIKTKKCFRSVFACCK